MRTGASWKSWNKPRDVCFALILGLLILGTCQVSAGGLATTAEPSAERGRLALTQGAWLKPAWKDEAYRDVAQLWRIAVPDPIREPDEFAAAFRRRYGLHPAPFPNDGFPMGLRRGLNESGKRTGLQIDCMICHGGSIGGTSYVGLGNTQLDLRALLYDMTRASGQPTPFSTFTLNSSRGTNNAGMIAAVLLSLRNVDLSTRRFPLPLGVNLPEMDTPPWWHLKRKRTMYYDGRTPAASVRSNMQFLLGEKSLEQFKELEPTFRDLQAFFKSLEPPKYLFAIDGPRAERGKLVFQDHCVRCHGTYGPDASYPNKIVSLDVIGTDPARAKGLSDRLVAHYNATWFGENHPANPIMTGYQAPPLDGIWATAPYLHNGSVPSLRLLLDSSKRPTRFTRPPSTDFEHYDTVNVGWKFKAVESSTPPSLTIPTSWEATFTVDTTRFGMGNAGHLFGDELTEDERSDVLEYLKTL